MPFMQPEIVLGRHWRVETQDGTWFVPNAVAGEPPLWFADKRELVFDGEPAGLRDVFAELLQDYVEPDAARWLSLSIVVGYCGRLQAPGHLDATEWSFARSRREIERELKGMYG